MLNQILILIILTSIYMKLSSSLNLTSQSPLQKQQLRKVKTILQLLMDNGDSCEFHERVNWQELGLLDYPIIIKNPIDLSTVKSRIQTEHYNFVEQILDDIQRIWDNCKLYNQHGSWIYSLADKMDKYYKKLIKNYFSHLCITNPTKIIQQQEVPLPAVTRFSRATSKKEKTDSKVYHQEQEGKSNQKYRLIDHLKKLNKQNLGKIVQIILESCPQACTFIQQSHCQINIEAIQPRILNEVKEKSVELCEIEDRFTKRVKI